MGWNQQEPVLICKCGCTSDQHYDYGDGNYICDKCGSCEGFEQDESCYRCEWSSCVSYLRHPEYVKCLHPASFYYGKDVLSKDKKRCFVPETIELDTHEVEEPRD